MVEFDDTDIKRLLDVSHVFTERLLSVTGKMLAVLDDISIDLRVYIDKPVARNGIDLTTAIVGAAGWSCTFGRLGVALSLRI